MAPELVETMLRLYAETGSVHKVARRLGIGSSTVHRTLSKTVEAIPARGSLSDRLKKTALKTEEAARPVVEAYCAGESLASIAARHACSVGAVRSVVKAFEVERRPRGGQPKAVSLVDLARIRELYLSGLSVAQVAAVVKRNYSTVRNKLLNDGLLRASASHARGSLHGQWKGGVVKDSAGYLLEGVLPDSPFASMSNSSGYVRQHRLRVAEFLGRPLLASETVHHKDGNRTNNSLENLQLRHGQHGAGVVMRCRCCGSHDIGADDL